jgi:KUP system potassium uptake protein
VPRVAGTAIYLTSDPGIVPSALFHNLKHYRVMHERTVFLNVLNEDVPWIADAERISVCELAPSIYSVAVRFGFREEPDVPAALEGEAARVLDLEPMLTTFFVARSMIVDGPGELPSWRAGLYSWMTRQSESAASYFRLPANQVVELGTQVML